MKNIKLFSGKPLIWWVLNAAQNCDTVDEIVLATDCEEISSVVHSFNLAKVKVFHRSKENAQSHSSTESVILEYLAQADHSRNDKLILAQATSPFTTSQDFQSIIDFCAEEEFDSLLSVIHSHQFFWKEGQPLNYDFQNRPRRQDFEGQHLENGALYISKVGDILESKCRLSGKIGFHVMPSYTSIELDHEDDWIIGEAVMERLRNKTS